MAKKQILKVALSQVEDLNLRILRVQRTLDNLKTLPPALGMGWREGMIKYYERVLQELESFRPKARKAGRAQST